MSKLLISYVNDWAAGTVTASSEHPSFPAINTQHRWFKKVYRSKYGAGSGWGLFRFTATDNLIYFDEGGGTLTATIAAGDYDTTTACAAIKAAMEVAGALTYTVTYSDTTKLFTIAGSGNFVLELSGTTNAAWTKLGWTSGVDTASAATHTAEVVRIHTSEFLYGDLGSTKTILEIVIKNHNLSASASVTARLYSDAFVTLVDSVVLTYHAGQIGIRTSKSVRYIAIEVSDPTNPDGYIEIGLVWIADATQLHYGFTMDRSETPEDPSIESESDDGQCSTIQLTKYKGWTYTFDAVKPSDRPGLLSTFEEIGKTRPCFIVPAPPASGDIGETAQYVKLVGWEWGHVAGLYWGLDLEVKTER